MSRHNIKCTGAVELCMKFFKSRQIRESEEEKTFQWLMTILKITRNFKETIGNRRRDCRMNAKYFFYSHHVLRLQNRQTFRDWWSIESISSQIDGVCCSLCRVSESQMTSRECCRHCQCWIFHRHRLDLILFTFSSASFAFSFHKLWSPQKY